MDELVGVIYQGQTHGSAPTQYKYNRRSLRLKHYDYSREGFYFITIFTQNRLHLFGEIVDDVMVLNVAGEMVNKLWYEIIDDFPNIALHEFVIMPNHIHGIIEIVDKKKQPVGADSISAQICIQENINNTIELRADMESAPTGFDIPKIIQSFKRHTTLKYIKMVKNNTCPPFDKRIWQRNYYEHIIRDDVDYERISEYIINNPMTWDDDVLSKNQYK